MLPKSELQAQIEPLKRELVHEMAIREPKNWRMRQIVAIDITLKCGPTKSCHRARRACTLAVRKRTSSAEEDRVRRHGEADEKPRTVKSVIENGRRILSETNCTKLAGALLICCRRSCDQTQ